MICVHCRRGAMHRLAAKKQRDPTVGADAFSQRSRDKWMEQVCDCRVHSGYPRLLHHTLSRTVTDLTARADADGPRGCV
jgi:hypothetical protein